jgi:hypothetical protein
MTAGRAIRRRATGRGGPREPAPIGSTRRKGRSVNAEVLREQISRALATSRDGDFARYFAYQVKGHLLGRPSGLLGSPGLDGKEAEILCCWKTMCPGCPTHPSSKSWTSRGRHSFNLSAPGVSARGKPARSQTGEPGEHVFTPIGSLPYSGSPRCSTSRAERPASSFLHVSPLVRGRWGETDPQEGRPGTQPANAAACFTQIAICASSSSPPSWMSIQRASLLRTVPPGGIGRSDVPRKKVTLT